jgi:tRNA threonylcarbamoyladenosine biosynthesis protein TsaE
MVTSISHNSRETEALGEVWGRSAASGLVIGLVGELGAGKTQLVKGLARGLGAGERVHSPTFALLNQYISGRLPLFHLDLYRLDTPAEIQAAGLEEYLCTPNGVSVVEWIDHWLPFAAATPPLAPSPSCPSGPKPTADPEQMITAGGVGSSTARSSSPVPSTQPIAALLPAGDYRLVWIEVLDEHQRRISYEDIGP